MWPGSLASAVAYRWELKATPVRWLFLLCAVSLAGGFLGAVLLVRTSDTVFMRLLPWLMLVAAVTFSFDGRLRPSSTAPHETHDRIAVVAVLRFALSIYGGYFGGGMGIMMLATYAIAGMLDIHEMNALKTLLGVAINGLALTTFVVKRVVAWMPGFVMLGSAVIGVYFGAAIARKIEPRWVRGFVIVIGWTMTIYFFMR